MVQKGMNTLPSKKRLLAGLLLAGIGMAGSPQAAVTGQILPDETFAEADADSLKAEARLFVRIKDGVMLTLAECEISADACSPSVGIREVERLLETIDMRITMLTERYTETGNPELEKALLVYADAREGYTKALEKLETLKGREDEDALEDDAFLEDLERGDF